jgi:hypothetical protein
MLHDLGQAERTLVKVFCRFEVLTAIVAIVSLSLSMVISPPDVVQSWIASSRRGPSQAASQLRAVGFVAVSS